MSFVYSGIGSLNVCVDLLYMFCVDFRATKRDIKFLSSACPWGHFVSAAHTVGVLDHFINLKLNVSAVFACIRCNCLAIFM